MNETGSTYEFVVQSAMQLTPLSARTFLDYGCGAGEIVKLAVDLGMDAYGVDLFYEGGSYRNAAEENGLFGTRIFDLHDQMIPFPDAKFDVVVSNQVFEHIDDFQPSLAEINRVLKPGGVFLNHFPTKDVWREGHIGIPFVHRFPRGSRVRYCYAYTLRALGLGLPMPGHSVRQWCDHCLNWIDQWTHYKPLSEAAEAFSEYFEMDDQSTEYLIYRLQRRSQIARRLAGVYRLAICRPFLRFLCHRLSGRVFVLRKRH